MNTIPSIFNQREINRTILGGSEVCPNIRMDASVVLLNNSWSPSRLKSLEAMLDCGFKDVISIERNPNNYNIEDISRRFPSVKFIIPLEEVTDGDLVNTVMHEVDSEYVVILRDTIEYRSNLITPKLFSKMTETKPFCVCPWLTLQNGVSFPIVSSPSSNKSVFAVSSTAKITDGAQNLYPFDGIAMFNRKKFISLGGYDYTIKSTYWQNLDLAFRSWLWGERTVLSSIFTLSYGSDRATEDTTASQYSNRFYLKNLVPRFIRDHAEIPLFSFFLFLPRSSCGFIEALRQFNDARRWVRENQYRFHLDAVSLIESWGSIAEYAKTNIADIEKLAKGISDAEKKDKNHKEENQNTDNKENDKNVELEGDLKNGK